jgi:flagellar hook-basal body complex protein FliE
MVAPILPVTPASVPIAPIVPAAETSGSAFRDVLSGAIQNVESFRQNASASVERLLSGEGEELHSTIIATQQAELSFELFQQVRNKVVSAYQEIMRMQM